MLICYSLLVNKKYSPPSPLCEQRGVKEKEKKMLGIVNKPDIISLSENPMEVQISTNNRFSTEGVKAITSLTFNQTDTVGKTIILNWDIYSETFTCAASPNDSGNQYRDNSMHYSLSDWVLLLKDAFKSNYNLARDFEITKDGNKNIQFVAKETGAKYTLDLDVDSTSVALYGKNAGVTEVARPFYNILLQTFIKDGTIFRKIGEDSVTPDANNYARFDVSEYVRPELTSYLTWPENATVIVKNHPELSKEIKLAFTETYTGTIKKLNYINGLFAIKGGLSKMKQTELKDAHTTFFKWYGSYSSFLTWHPVRKKVSFFQPEKLYWLNKNPGLTHVSVMVMVVYKDAHTDAFYTRRTFDSNFGEIQEITCTFNKMLPAKQKRDVAYYIVNLKETNGNRLTENRIYEMDNIFNINKKTFLFRNSYGVFETIVLEGGRINEADYARLVINQALPYNFTWRSAEKKNVVNTENQTFQANSGWKNRELINWMRDFLLSKEIYELDNWKMYPVVITSKKAGISKDDDYLCAIDLEYSRAYTDEHFSMDSTIKKDAYNYAVPMFGPSDYGDGFQVQQTDEEAMAELIS